LNIGVGKTMTARALVESCNCYTDRKIAFFVRKGSDILNPYLGQSEANLTKLFDAVMKLYILNFAQQADFILLHCC